MNAPEQAPPPAAAAPKLSLTLDYAGHPIRITGTKDGPLWVATDVCKAIELKSNVANRLKRCDSADIGWCRLETVRGWHRAATVTSRGLVALLFPTKHKAKVAPFWQWVSREVLPSIRAHGTYPAPSATKRKPGRPAGTPRYQCHAGKRLAFTWIDGRRIYLGKYNTPESRRRFDELIADWKRGHAPHSPQVTPPLQLDEGTIRQNGEKLIRMSQIVVDWLPDHAPYTVCLTVAYGWTTQGVKGIASTDSPPIRLEAIEVDGVRYTSIEACRRFFVRIAPPTTAPPLRAPPSQRPARRSLEATADGRSFIEPTAEQREALTALFAPKNGVAAELFR